MMLPPTFPSLQSCITSYPHRKRISISLQVLPLATDHFLLRFISLLLYLVPGGHILCQERDMQTREGGAFALGICSGYKNPKARAIDRDGTW